MEKINAPFTCEELEILKKYKDWREVEPDDESVLQEYWEWRDQRYSKS